MIIFCEDCGKRNQISDEQIVKHRAVFKCSECGYPNNFAVRDSQIPTIKLFADALKKNIVNSNAAVGAFVYGREKCIINLMPKNIKPKEIDFLARHLTASYYQAARELESLYEMSATIKKNTISMIKNRHNITLVVVCRENVGVKAVLDKNILKTFNELRI